MRVCPSTGAVVPPRWDRTLADADGKLEAYGPPIAIPRVRVPASERGSPVQLCFG